MATANVTTSAAALTSTSGFLEREHIVARPGYSRWLVPPCALAIHLCIGMVYGFSVFWLPLSTAIGITKSIPCPADAGLLYYLTTTTCDWKVPMLQTWMFGLFFVFLGTAAALWGGWLERVGPRKAGLAAAVCWCGGLVISAIGISQHQLWLIWLGPGIIGGLGLGLGYISPVSTLIKWFPDRRGMATGMDIMVFAAYLSDLFGTRMVGAIHGRLLTAWSAAGVLGPLLVGAFREYQLAHGVPKAQVYNTTMFVLAGLLVIGFICNLLIRPVSQQYVMTPEQIAALDAASQQGVPTATGAAVRPGTLSPAWAVALAWLAVGIPLAWGVWQTLRQAAKLLGLG